MSTAHKMSLPVARTTIVILALVITLARAQAAQDDARENEDKSQTEFTWNHHQEDHSIYARRSLMSTEQIRADGAEHSSRTEDDDEQLDPLETRDFAEKEWQLMFRAFDMIYDSASTSVLQQIGKHTNLFEEIVGRLEPKCRRDIYHVRDSIRQHKLWALRMVDSNGKLPSGITYGKFSSPGDYEECLSVNVDNHVHRPVAGSEQFATEHYKFYGQYCLLDFRLPMPERPKDTLLSIHTPVIDLSKTDIGKLYPDFANYSGYASALYEVGYMHAFCLPSSCDINDLTKSFTQAIEGLHITVNNTIDCQVRHNKIEMRTSQYISILLFGVLFANAFVATLIHYLARPSKKCTDDGYFAKSPDRHQLPRAAAFRQRTGWMDEFKARHVRRGFYTECFSVQTNFERLVKPDPRGLTFVHYTRIVAMALTVITHTAGMGTLQAITKPADASNSEQIFRDLIPQMLANAFTSIQIFFFMAGFMLVVSTYPSIKRERGHVSFLEYSIKRAIRLIPGLLATICVNFLWPLFVDGPMLSYFTRLIVQPCESNWWRTLGFLSNFDHVEKMCLRHSYFSASDYQLHMMAFPLLILLYRQPIAALCVAALLTVAGFVAQVIMILTKTVMPFMMVDYIDKEAFFNVVHYIHHPVWNHMSAFFYGFIIGYFVVKQIRLNLSETFIRRAWMVSAPVGLVSIFAPYFWNHYKRPIHKWQMVLYVIFDRFALLTVCAWLSYATMVLGRRPKTDKTSKSGASNLPQSISIQREKTSPMQIPQINPTEDEQFAKTSEHLSAPKGLPKQRSSPNLMLTQLHEGSNSSEDSKNQSMSRNLRPAISSSDLVKEASAAQEENRHAEVKTETKQKKPSSVANVNTLCLMLSRLTFQLYLFNMVVLWIDVNHSKYFWFFSYYFIITKALAVYVASAIFAMLFFITLESPSLTLYIMWVRLRARQRAEKQSRSNQARVSADTTNYCSKSSDKPIISHNPTEGTASSPSPSRDTDTGSGSYDGICMGAGDDTTADQNQHKQVPIISCVDVSSPTQEEALQTRM